MKISLNHIVKASYYLSLAYFSYLMILITVQYLPIDFEAAFLRIKQDEIKLKHYQIAFFTHVYISVFTLFFGSFQFSNFIRSKYTRFHKYVGYLYVVSILLFASPTGFIMGYYANGGVFSQISFCLLSVLWFYFTLQAMLKIKRNDWIGHKKFMMRSYALTLSAITLRLFKYVIVSLFELPPMDTYKIVAWSWVVNLIFVEFLIIFFKNDKLNKAFKTPIFPKSHQGNASVS